MADDFSPNGTNGEVTWYTTYQPIPNENETTLQGLFDLLCSIFYKAKNSRKMEESIVCLSLPVVSRKCTLFLFPNLLGCNNFGLFQPRFYTPDEFVECNQFFESV